MITLVTLYNSSHSRLHYSFTKFIFLGMVPAFFSTLYISSWGDYVGRRPPLLISMFGIFILVILHIVIFYYQLSVAYILIPRIICGLCGDFSTVTASCFAYYADTSHKEDRTTKLALGEASIGLAGLLANLISGVWVESQVSTK